VLAWLDREDQDAVGAWGREGCLGWAVGGRGGGVVAVTAGEAEEAGGGERGSLG
jgi:hypothetical protein